MRTLQNKSTAQNSQDLISLHDMLYHCLHKWHWFVISLLVCLGVAAYYLLSTSPVYVRTASILIKDDSRGKSSSDVGAFSDLGLFSTSVNVNNEMGSLTSPDIMQEVVSRLQLNVNYFIDGTFHKKTIYGTKLPVHVSFANLAPGESASFVLHLAKDGNVQLTSFERNGEESGEEEVVKGRLNDNLQTPLGTIVVSPSYTYTNESEGTIYVSHMPMDAAASGCMSRLSVYQNDDKSNIVKLSYQDVSTQRAEDVLNTLIAVYNENWVEDKNQIAISTSMFINDRLRVIEGELGNVDNDISSFKSEHLLPDVQAAASMYMAQANEANASIRSLNNQVYMAKYIKDYLTQEKNKYQLLPANSGLESSSLATQLSEYNKGLLERNSLVAHSSSKNPLVKEMDKSLNDLRRALVTSIDNQLVALHAQIKSQQAIGGQATTQIASNPKQSKYLLSVERQQKVKESLYLYLLQKREENELSQAFTAYNTRVITKPTGSNVPTAPVRNKILIVALVLGLLIPVVVIFLRENMNTTVRGKKDLEGLGIPFIGEIPMFISPKRKGSVNPNEMKSIIVEEGNRDVVNEAFRVLRTNLEFMVGKDRTKNVIVVTSFNPASGKSVLTMNIAVSLAIKKMKVLVIDGDLRHGSTSCYLHSPKLGLSNYLNGQIDNVSEIIVKGSKYSSLDVLPIGTIPPNPTELLFDDRFKQAIMALKEQYDFVFIDCPPIELVADTHIIEKLADRTIFIVRAGLLERSMLPELESIFQENKFKNMSLILNGTESSNGRYGYKYGYHYGYGAGHHYHTDEK